MDCPDIPGVHHVEVQTVLPASLLDCGGECACSSLGGLKILWYSDSPCMGARTEHTCKHV